MKHNLNVMLLVACITAFTSQKALPQHDCCVSTDRPICNDASACNDISACCDVYVANPTYTIDTEFRFLFLKPSASNLHYVAQARPLPIQSPSWSIYELDPGYNFALDFGVRAFYHNSCTSYGFNTTYFKSTTSNAYTVPVATDMVGPFFEIGPDASLYKIAAGGVQFKFDSTHLNFGQLVRFGQYLQTNFYAGINATLIKQNMTSFYSNDDATTTRTITSPTKFVGAGPEFGVDFAFNITHGLNLTGKFFAAVLVGRLRNDTTYTSVSPLLATLNRPSPNIQHTAVETRTVVVPAFEERLAFAYCLPFCCHYRAKFEVGYEARLYLDVIQSVDMASEVDAIATRPASVGVFARTFKRTISNFALAGPYVSFNMAF